MALSDTELGILEELSKGGVPSAPAPGRTQPAGGEEEITRESIMASATAPELFMLVNAEIEELSFLIDEILKKPEIERDVDTIDFLSNLKGQLISASRDVNKIKEGTYRELPGEEMPEGTESVVKPQLMPGESLMAKRPTRPGESYTAPGVQEIFG